MQDALFQVNQDDDIGDQGSVSLPETVADRVSGFRPVPGRKPSSADLPVRLLWRSGENAVRALTLTAGRGPTVVAADSAGVTLRNIASGAQEGPVLAGSAVAVASLQLPDGTTIIAAAGHHGALRWWGTATGELRGAEAAGGTAPVLSLAPVLIPTSARKIDGPLAGFRDGRTMLAAGDADGVVRLWDPVARVPLAPLFRRPGRRVVSLTAVNFVKQPPWDGTDLVAVYDDLLIDVWSSRSVHGRLSTMTPDAAKLAAIGHGHIISAAMSPSRLGYRRPVLLADRNGTVSMWETFGTRLGDPLPPDPAHREVTGIAVLPGPRDDITVLTTSHADSSLRAWQPLAGATAVLPLNVRPHCVVSADTTLMIGHDDGLVALSLIADRS